MIPLQSGITQPILGLFLHICIRVSILIQQAWFEILQNLIIIIAFLTPIPFDTFKTQIICCPLDCYQAFPTTYIYTLYVQDLETDSVYMPPSKLQVVD